MALYEIDSRIAAAIESAIDPETGELLDESMLEGLESLQMEKDAEVEELGCCYKNLMAEVSAFKTEIAVLKERQAKAQERADKIKSALQLSLNGEKFSSAKCQITYRKSSITIAGPEFVEWAEEKGRDDLLTYKEPAPALRAIKQAIDNGETIPGASVETNYTMQIK